MITKKEEKQLYNMINEYQIDPTFMYIKMNNDKYIFGIKTENKNLNRIYMYNHFLQSAIDLSTKTKNSIIIAMDYCKKIKTKFNPFNNHLSENEYYCYYYMENALYRLEMLWETLGQLYNLYAEENLNISKIYYKKLFESLFKNKPKTFNVDKIHGYLFEDSTKDKNNINVGVREYIKNLRNVNTHRYSLSITAMSNNVEDLIHIREAPPYLLFKLCFDYNKVMDFLSSVFDKIILENKNTIKKHEKTTNKLFK